MKPCGKLKMILIAILFCGFGSAASACDALEQVKQAAASGDRSKLTTLRAQTRVTVFCDETDVALISRYEAWSMFNEIVMDVGAGTPLIAMRESLDAAREIAPVWQVLDGLGELALARGDYIAAAGYYNDAVADASEEKLTPDAFAPDPEYLRRLIGLADRMRLAVPSAAAGGFRASCKIKFRGIKINKRNVPIRFVTNEVTFTPAGEEEANRTLKCLKANDVKRVKVIAHTDPRGERSYNQLLSERRANALAKYLMQHGFSGDVIAIGLGEDSPLDLDDIEAYDADTLNGMLRRAEIDILETGRE